MARDKELRHQVPLHVVTGNDPGPWTPWCQLSYRAAATGPHGLQSGSLCCTSCGFVVSCLDPCVQQALQGSLQMVGACAVSLRLSAELRCFEHPLTTAVHARLRVKPC